MRKILIILGLILCGSALFGQSPRIRLNQITKDSLTGSVVLSGSDSNMVYSRDFFLNLTDSVLILFGDTLSTTATAFTGVATDLTLTGNGTVGNELKVDTAIIATVSALADSLAGIISSVTTDLTLTGDGSVSTPLKVDTSVIATIRALADSVATRGTVTDITAGTFLSGGTITTSGTIALDTASAGLKTYISDNKGTVNLASGVTGTLPVANGGTGATSLTANKVLVGNGTSAVLQPTNLHWDNTNSRLGIGTTSPSEKLDIQGTMNMNGASGTYLQVQYNGSNTGYLGTANATVASGSTSDLGISALSNLVFGTGGSLTERMRITSSGNVGIGTTAPGSRLHIKSSTANDALLVEDDDGACEAQPTTTGLTWSCSSDQRLKTDIQIPAAVLNYVKNIPLKDYTVIKTAERVMGPIAQELLETYPELVTTGEDGYYRVSSLGSWTLVKAIQEQQAIIETQQQEIETLKTQYNDLLQRIINLENK